MSLKLGTTAIDGLYLGSTPINKVYLGSVEVFNSAPASASILSIASNGWQATYDGTPTDYQPATPVTLTRQGYDGSFTSPGGVPTPTLLTNISETITCRHRVRNAYPDDSSEPVWGDDVALSSWVYSTDSVPGMSGANNSIETSPKPTCGWAIPDRKVVGNSINLQLVAFHRNARLNQQVACVVFSATDGTDTVYSLVDTSSILSAVGGSYSFSDIREEGFETDLDITSLDDNSLITVNATVYPWVGGASSVQTSDSANNYEFAPLYFQKNTSKATNPPLVYVASTGTDATVDVNGVNGGNTKVSTNAVTAKANAFLTIKSALEALKAATNVTGGFTDGCEVRIVDATALGATSLAAGTYTQNAAVKITRDPLVSRAAASMSISIAIATRHQFIVFSDMSIVRSANVTPSGTGTEPKFIMENVNLDNGSFSSAPFNSALRHYWVNVTVTNSGASMWNSGSTHHNLIRGCTISSGTVSIPESNVLIGNRLTRVPGSSATRQLNRLIVAFNKFHSIGTASGVWATLVGTYSNSAIVQNVFEYISATQAGFIQPSSDGTTYNLQNFIFTDNTIAGAMNAGRINTLYDETNGTYRNHKLTCMKRNVYTTWTTKTDYFLGVVGGANSTETVQHTGVHPIIYAVDIDEIHSAWPDANVQGYGYDTLDRRWAYYGPYLYGDRSSVPTGTTGFVEALNDPKFKTNSATTYAPGGTPLSGSYTAGAGDGDYRPQRISQGDASDSPLLSKVLVPALRYDLRGVARDSIDDTIGAYS